MSRFSTTSRTWRVVLVLGLFLVAVNLRAGLIAVPPFMEAIQADTGLTSSAAGIILALPPICYALFSISASCLARRIGTDVTVLLAMIVLACGTLLRIAPPLPMLFVGTVVMGMAITCGNVLVPALIKRDFPDLPGPMTAMYGLGMSLGGTLAAAVVVPIEERTGLGWRGVLALMAIPVALAALALLPRLRINDRPPPGAHNAQPRPRLWGNLMAWQVSLCMGLQSFLFYGLGTWTPTILTEHGVSKTEAAVQWSLCNLGTIPVSLIVPMLVTRKAWQRAVMLVLIALLGTAILGMLLAPTTLTWLWMILLGGGANGAFSAALIFLVQRTPDTTHAAALSGMAQSIGYGVSAAGPFLVGVGHDITGSWSVPIAGLLVVLAAFAWAALGACRDDMVAPTPTSQPIPS